jgi:hypothetical protein
MEAVAPVPPPFPRAGCWAGSAIGELVTEAPGEGVILRSATGRSGSGATGSLA